MDRPSLMGKNILHLICNSTFLKRVPGAKEEQQVFATESVRPMAISKHFSWSCSGLLTWFEAPSAPIRYREQLSQPKVRGMGLDDDPVSLTKWGHERKQREGRMWEKRGEWRHRNQERWLIWSRSQTISEKTPSQTVKVSLNTVFPLNIMRTW